MSRLRWEANLDGLCRRLASYATADLTDSRVHPCDRAGKLSDSLYLAHSTSDARFAGICASGHLVSAPSLDADCTEIFMGTAGSVFFYVAPFRYPNTNCGLLFAKSLESEYTNNAAASPFDSGGLRKIFR